MRIAGGGKGWSRARGGMVVGVVYFLLFFLAFVDRSRDSVEWHSSCKLFERYVYFRGTVRKLRENPGKLVETSFSPLHVSSLLGSFSVGKIWRVLFCLYGGGPRSHPKTQKKSP